MRSSPVERIGRDLGVARIADEEEDLFACRCVYSALRWWSETACMDVGKEGDLGITKQLLTRRLVRYVEPLVRAYPTIEEYLSVEGGFGPYVYARLMNCDDLVPSGDGTQLLATRQAVQILPSGDRVLTGFYDPTEKGGVGVRITSGLGTLLVGDIPNVPSVGVNDARLPSEWLLASLSWVPSKTYGEVGYADLSQSAWSLWKNSLWTGREPEGKEVGLARCAIAGRSTKWLLARKRRAEIEVAEIPYDIACSKYLDLMSSSGKQIVCRFRRCDERYIQFAAPLTLMGSTGRFLDLLSWPVKSIADSYDRYMRVEAFRVFEWTCESLGMRIVEANR